MEQLSLLVGIIVVNVMLADGKALLLSMQEHPILLVLSLMGRQLLLDGMNMGSAMSRTGEIFNCRNREKPGLGKMSEGHI